MRILEIEITKFRGIQHLALNPNKKNCVIWGPNGSGKSAVVDAIDFLLTGKVLRLTGKGTEGINLKQHAPHIDCDAKDSKIRALVQLRDNENPIQIERCVSNPNKLICDSEKETLLQPILAFAARGQHILTRREILRFITSEAGTRSADIQDLLNLTEIEEVRKSFVKVKGEYDRNCKSSLQVVNKMEMSVFSLIGKSSLNQDDLGEFINNNRKILNGKPLEQFDSKNLKSELSPPKLLSKSQFNTFSIEKDIENINKLMTSQNLGVLNEVNQELKSLIGIINNDPTRLKALSLQQLTKLGLELIDETENCPLCDLSWENDKLRQHLEKRLLKAKDAKQTQDQIENLSENLKNNSISLINSLVNLKSVAERKNIDFKEFEKWIKKLEIFRDFLNDPVNNYSASETGKDNLANFFAPDEWFSTCSKINSAIQNQTPVISPEQIAWDELTRLAENLANLENAQKEFKSADLLARRSVILLNSFQTARDSVLEKLYSKIQNRFVTLYKKIHNHDEDTFSAVFEQTEAKLNIGVDFHGRGFHPPHALHSEGHQDTMGLCLYLTLAEHLTAKVMDLIILDDVVMSVDAEHRRDICDLFSSEFPDKQFIITTHDRTWANQLKARGVVKANGCFEFYNWKIQTGPQINNETDLWKKIENDLENNDISGAAGKLRRASEERFSMVCDSLEAKVPYKSNFRWELSDLLNGSLAQYKNLVKKGKEAANSWANKEKIDYLTELESIKNQIVQRANIEQWIINDSVHYNSWSNYTINDFRPIVEAFQDLFSIFSCVKCESLLTVSTDNKKQPVGVRCNCGEQWSLTGKAS